MIHSVYRAALRFFRGPGPRAARVLPLPADNNPPAGAARLVPQNPAPPRPEAEAVTPPLALRDVRLTPRDPARMVPQTFEVIWLLDGQAFDDSLALGIALRLPPRALLHMGGWADPVQRIQALLLMADYPMGMADLAQALEDSPLRAHEVANQVRLLAQQEGIDWIEFGEQAICDKLARVLAPLATESETLATNLGLTCDDWQELAHNLARPRRYSALHQLISRDALGTADRPGLSRTCEGWLEAAARAGMEASSLEAMARHWQVTPESLSPSCASWSDYRNRCTDSSRQHLLTQLRLSPRSPLPLEQVWPLVHPYRAHTAFPLAFEDATDPAVLAPEDRDLAAILSLLRYAAARGRGEAVVDWSCLRHLARLGCLDPELAAVLLQEQEAEHETVSRRLRPSDLLRLVTGDEPEREALEMAALLGVGDVQAGLDDSWAQATAQERALCSWRRIYNRVPWLETGHLAVLFRQFDKRPLLEKLTGDTESSLLPVVPVPLHSERVMNFVGLRELLDKQPALIEAFVARHQLAQRASFEAPPGTDELWCLLNCLAHDDLLLRQFRAFEEESRLSATTAPRTSPTAATASELEQDRTRSGHPFAFICPISWDYMDDPVAISQGGTQRYFSRQNLLRALQYRPLNPLTGEELLESQVPTRVDTAYRARIRRWREQHPELEEGAVPFVPPAEAPPDPATP